MNINKLLTEIENELPFVNGTLGKYRNDDSVIKNHLAELRGMIADYQAFYKAMVGQDSQNELKDFLQATMFAEQKKAGVMGDVPFDAITQWADYDALLGRLKAHEEATE